MHDIFRFFVSRIFGVRNFDRFDTNNNNGKWIGKFVGKFVGEFVVADRRELQLVSIFLRRARTHTHTSCISFDMEERKKEAEKRRTFVSLMCSIHTSYLLLLLLVFFGCGWIGNVLPLYCFLLQIDSICSNTNENLEKLTNFGLNKFYLK